MHSDMPEDSTYDKEEGEDVVVATLQQEKGGRYLGKKYNGKMRRQSGSYPKERDSRQKENILEGGF